MLSLLTSTTSDDRLDAHARRRWFAQASRRLTAASSAQLRREDPTLQPSRSRQAISVDGRSPSSEVRTPQHMSWCNRRVLLCVAVQHRHDGFGFAPPGRSGHVLAGPASGRCSSVVRSPPCSVIMPMRRDRDAPGGLRARSVSVQVALDRVVHARSASATPGRGDSKPASHRAFAIAHGDRRTGVDRGSSDR